MRGLVTPIAKHLAKNSTFLVGVAALTHTAVVVCFLAEAICLDIVRRPTIVAHWTAAATTTSSPATAATTAATISSNCIWTWHYVASIMKRG